MNDIEIASLFDALWADLNHFDYLIQKRPLLAHYTSINTLEKILKSNELWFSNPLLMNDLEEVRFGVHQGVRVFRESAEVDRICGSSERINILRSAFEYFYKNLVDQNALDIYVFCLSEHNPKDIDGRLSMWRGYGGNGRGAALIFNTNHITDSPDNGPLIIAKVHYNSAAERISLLEKKLNQWCKILESSSIPNDKLSISAWQFFNFILLFALTSKHHGFIEEHEWRVIYMPEHDINGIYKNCFDYVMGTNGAEPILKLPLLPIPDSGDDWTFYKILEQVILGPSVASQLARLSIHRMLEKIGKPEFKSKILSSGIPLRPTT